MEWARRLLKTIVGRQSVWCGIEWMILCREKGENERYRSHGPAALDGGSAYAASWGILSILKLVTSEGWLMRRDIPRKPLPPQTTSFFFAAEAIECGGVSRCGKRRDEMPKARSVDVTHAIQNDRAEPGCACCQDLRGESRSVCRKPLGNVHTPPHYTPNAFAQHRSAACDFKTFL